MLVTSTAMTWSAAETAKLVLPLLQSAGALAKVKVLSVQAPQTGVSVMVPGVVSVFTYKNKVAEETSCGVALAGRIDVRSNCR
jgi:hypothetical protein